jgi:molybdate transport system substrate-binding protein
MIPRSLGTAAFALTLATASIAAEAEEIRLLSPVALRAAMPEIVAKFETSSGHKLKIEYATAGAIVDRLQKGESADAAIASTAQIDSLLGQGKITAGTRTQFARVGVGVFVRINDAKPDLTSVDSFKRALLDAKAIGYGDPAKGGVSGTAMAALVERLGIAADLRVKTRLYPDSQAVLTAVAAGEVSIGIGLTSDTALAAGVDLAGGLPAQIQNFTYYAAGAAFGGKQVEAASKLVAFLTSPSAKAVLSAKGFEPQ